MRSAKPTEVEPIPLGPKASARAAEVYTSFANRPDEIPDDNSRQNLASLQRNMDADRATGAAGDTGVPESVREVISSSGQSLDASIQRAVEDRMGDSFGDVRIHTGPTAAKACEDINARAFTVGNHIAFNSGEYDPESPQGQHLLAHELAHVRQQTGGAISMMPQANVELEIDPDPQLEREAEETAQRVMEGGELGIQRMAKTEVHVQRAVQGAGAVAAGNSKRISDLLDRVSSIETTLEDVSETQDDHGRKIDAHEDSVGRLWSEVGKLRSVGTNSTEKSFSTPEKIAMGIGGGALLGGTGDFLKEGMSLLAGSMTGDPVADLAIASAIGATAGGVTALAGMGLDGLKDLFAQWRSKDTTNVKESRDEDEKGDQSITSSVREEVGG